MYKFKVGDRVEVISEFSLVPSGNRGTIRELRQNSWGDCAVEFDEQIKGVFLHDCDGLIKSNLGRWGNTINLKFVGLKPSVELGQYRITPRGSIWKVQTHTYEGNTFGCICVKDSEFHRFGEWFHATAEEIDDLSVVCDDPNNTDSITSGAGIRGRSTIESGSYYETIFGTEYVNQIEEDLRKLSR